MAKTSYLHFKSFAPSSYLQLCSDDSFLQKCVPSAANVGQTECASRIKLMYL